MRYEIINKHGSTFIHQEKDAEAAVHYAKEHSLKVRDRNTGKMCLDFCKKERRDNMISYNFKIYKNGKVEYANFYAHNLKDAYQMCKEMHPDNKIILL